MTAPTPPTVVWIVDECAELFERAGHAYRVGTMVRAWSDRLAVTTQGEIRDELAGRFAHVLTAVTSEDQPLDADELDVARDDLSTLMRFVRDAQRVLYGKQVHL